MQNLPQPSDITPEPPDLPLMSPERGALFRAAVEQAEAHLAAVRAGTA